MKRSHSVQVLAACALAGVTALTMTNSVVAGNAASAPPGAAERQSSQAEARGFYDVRRGTGSAARTAEYLAASKAAARPATKAFTNWLGKSALVDIDGTTGTPRLVARINGFLTPKSKRGPKSVALRFVRAHLFAFGLVASDLNTFHFRKDYTDITGTHHLSWTQRIDGVEIFGNGLQASVTDKGRLQTIGGSPVPASLLTEASGGKLDTSSDAIAAARKVAGEASLTPGDQDRAQQVLFVTPGRTYLAWRTITMSAAEPALSVLDARTGRLLFRQPLGHDESSSDRARARKGLAFSYFPGHRPRGGEPFPVNYTKRGWLARTAGRLNGNNAHTFADVNDDGRAQAHEEIPPSSGNRWNYRLKPFHLANISFCDNPWPCSWNPDQPFSWRTNRNQNGAQAFYFVNRFHDHLEDAPIGFTEDAGNFQRKNFTRQGEDGDAVNTQTDDGANTDHGLPDGAHVDNANMSTPPDGMAPVMQLYLQHQPGTSYPDGDPFSPTNVGDEADTVYHEYTHGLSNRLVVDPGGISSLGGGQAGAMGEGWGDWYAMDYLVSRKLQRDRPGIADLIMFQYDGEGIFLDRSEPLDCKVGSDAKRCTGGLTGHGGGYTYADYGDISGAPEVHDDGEIWAQTLWDLQNRLGSNLAESLVTRAMELAPYNPSFLDMRNAILMADRAIYSSAHRTRIWRTFARRGMGFYAGSLGGNDGSPAFDRHVPPTNVRRAFITGHVTDQDSGQPMAGVPVTLAFQGGNGLVNPTAITKADGSYRLGGVPLGHYRKITVSGAGFLAATKAVTVTPSGATRDFTVRKDWASASGGASIADYNGPDYSGFGCGPDQAIDDSQSSGWGSTTGEDDGTPTNDFIPKFIVIDMDTNVDITKLAVDPSATCGDGGSASMAEFRIETSPNGTAWTTAAEGTFTEDDRGQLNELTPTAGADGVRFVKLWMLSNQTPDFETNCPDGAFSGCQYTDLSEIDVYGAESP